MSLLEKFSFGELMTYQEILENIAALPTEEDLPCNGGEPMETPRHRSRCRS